MHVTSPGGNGDTPACMCPLVPFTEAAQCKHLVCSSRSYMQLTLLHAFKQHADWTMQHKLGIMSVLHGH